MNIQEIREKYPQYSDMSDEQLLKGLHKKFYSDMDYGEFSAKIGVNKSPEPKPEQTLGERLYEEETTGDLYTQPEFELNRRGVRMGVSDPVMAVGQMVGEATDSDLITEAIKKREQEYQQARKEAGRTGFDPYRTTGNVISTAVPGIAAAKAIAPATTLGKVGTGAATGMGYGVLNPIQDENFWTGKGAQAATGAAFGGAFPLIGKGVGMAYDKARQMINPLTESGKAQEVSKFLIDKAGPERERIIKAMQNAKELVPGSRPTAGQAIAQSAQPGHEFGGQLAKLESEVSKTPFIGNPLKNRYAQQELARNRIVSALAGTDDDMAAAIAKRSDVTGPLYERARQSSAKTYTKPVLDKIDDLMAKSINETDIVTPLSSIRAKLVDGGQDVQSLMSLSKEVKKMMGKITPGGQKEYNVSALNEIKNLLDDQIGKAEKAYRVANKLYERGSRPINRMSIGRELKKALVSPSEQERSTVFLNAMREAPRTIKKATGFGRRDTLEQYLKPEQVKSVKQISDDLINQAKTKQISKVDSVLKDLPSTLEIVLPRVLSRPVVIANHVLGKMAKDRSPEYQKILVNMLKDPASLEKALQAPVGSVTHKASNDILRELATFGVVEGVQ